MTIKTTRSESNLHSMRPKKVERRDHTLVVPGNKSRGRILRKLDGSMKQPSGEGKVLESEIGTTISQDSSMWVMNSTLSMWSFRPTSIDEYQFRSIAKGSTILHSYKVATTINLDGLQKRMFNSFLFVLMVRIARPFSSVHSQNCGESGISYPIILTV